MLPSADISVSPRLRGTTWSGVRRPAGSARRRPTPTPPRLAPTSPRSTWRAPQPNPRVHSRICGPSWRDGASTSWPSRSPSMPQHRHRELRRRRLVDRFHSVVRRLRAQRRLAGRCEVQHPQQLGHVNVFRGQASAKYVVGVGHYLDAHAVQVCVQVARGQIDPLAGAQASTGSATARPILRRLPGYRSPSSSTVFASAANCLLPDRT